MRWQANEGCDWPHNQPNLHINLCRLVQVAEENLAKTDQAAPDVSNPKFTRLVVETGISAFAQPAKLLVPLTAFVHSLRIISLALQIFYNNANAHLHGHRMSSELSKASCAMQFNDLLLLRTVQPILLAVYMFVITLFL